MLRLVGREKGGEQANRGVEQVLQRGGNPPLGRVESLGALSLVGRVPARLFQRPETRLRAGEPEPEAHDVVGGSDR